MQKSRFVVHFYHFLFNIQFYYGIFVHCVHIVFAEYFFIFLPWFDPLFFPAAGDNPLCRYICFVDFPNPAASISVIISAAKGAVHKEAEQSLLGLTPPHKQKAGKARKGLSHFNNLI